MNEEKQYEDFVLTEEFKEAQERLIHRFNFWAFNGGFSIILHSDRYTKEEIEIFNKQIDIAYKEKYNS